MADGKKVFLGPSLGPDTVTGSGDGFNSPGVLGSVKEVGGRFCVGVVGSSVDETGGVTTFGFLGGRDPIFEQRAGVYGESNQQGVIGHGSSDNATGVFGNSTGGGFGVRGESVE